MKVAVIGMGRMGRLVAETAEARGHEVVCRIDVDNQQDFDSYAFRSADVAIEFSVPSAAAANVERALRAGVPVVSGTTAWDAQRPAAEALARELGGRMLWASNFSTGVALFRAANRWLAKVMNRFPEYSPSITETHHTAKLDHPSGTAVTVATDLLGEYPALDRWEETDAPAPGVLPIEARREADCPGIHTVTWTSDADRIDLTHTAAGRQGFASGAVRAAEWLAAQAPGVYSIDDVYNI